VGKKNKKNTHNMLHISKEPAPATTNTANYFQVLYNLNDTGTQENPEVRSDTQTCTKNSNKKNHRPSTEESTKVIPVINNGVTLA
jgi:hypothetical protein